jgi:Family of unknown function (DUF6516)
MFGTRELEVLIEQAGVYPMPNGWQVVIRAEWTDVSAQRPHGLSYGLILQDERGERLLGFDNSHQFDFAGPDDPFDHEHKAGRVGQCHRYDFRSGSMLVSDFFARIENLCKMKGVDFAFVE